MIFDLLNLIKENKHQVGNKSLNLNILNYHKFNIPKGFVITDKNYNSSELKSKFIHYFGSDAKVIVRSSANYEDKENASFAGIYESYLNVSLEELEEKIDQVFNSIISEKALSYYSINQIPKEKVQMSVIVQEQIDPIISGVCFTKNPINLQNEIIVEYIEGNNNKFVSGLDTPKKFIFNPEFKQISETDELNNLELINSNLKSFKEIEKIFGTPQDIEWAIDQNKNLYILQSRNIILDQNYINYFNETDNQEPIAHGVGMSSGIGRGKLKFINTNLKFEDLKNSIQQGDIVWTHNLRVDQILAIQKASGIIMTESSLLSHVAIQAREFKIPCIGGIFEKNLFHEGQQITLNGGNGAIYEGLDIQDFQKEISQNKFPNYFNPDLVKEYQADNISFMYSIAEDEAMIYPSNIDDTNGIDKACEILNKEFKISPQKIHINKIVNYENSKVSSVYSYFQDYKKMISDMELNKIFIDSCENLKNIDTEGFIKITDQSRKKCHEIFKQGYILFTEFKETKNTDTLEKCAELLDRALAFAALHNNVVILSFGNYYLENHLKEINGPSLNELLEKGNFNDIKVQKLKELSNILIKYKNTELEPLSENNETFIDILDYIYSNGYERHVIKYQW